MSGALALTQYNVVAVVIQLLSHIQLFATPWTTQHTRLLCPPISSRVCSNSHPLSQQCFLTTFHPLLSSSPSAFNLSQHQVFSNESALCIKWLKYWSFSFRNSPSNEYSGLISFRTDWLDLLVAQDTLKSFLQHHFKNITSLTVVFKVQLSHPYTTTGKISSRVCQLYRCVSAK